MSSGRCAACGFDDPARGRAARFEHVGAAAAGLRRGAEAHGERRASDHEADNHARRRTANTNASAAPTARTPEAQPRARKRSKRRSQVGRRFAVIGVGNSFSSNMDGAAFAINTAPLRRVRRGPQRGLFRALDAQFFTDSCVGGVDRRGFVARDLDELRRRAALRSCGRDGFRPPSGARRGALHPWSRPAAGRGSRRDRRRRGRDWSP